MLPWLQLSLHYRFLIFQLPRSDPHGNHLAYQPQFKANPYHSGALCFSSPDCDLRLCTSPCWQPISSWYHAELTLYSQTGCSSPQTSDGVHWSTACTH